MQDAATSRWCAIPSTGWRWAPIARCTAAVRCADGHHLAQLRRQVAGTSPLTLRRGSSGHQGSTPDSAERHHAANGTLYNAELAKISKVEKVEDNLDNPPKLFVIYDDLPKDEAHGWKFLTIGPDNKLYFNVGAPCNICMPSPAPSSVISISTGATRRSWREAFGKWSEWTGTRRWGSSTSPKEDIPEDKLNRAPNRAGTIWDIRVHQRTRQRSIFAPASALACPRDLLERQGRLARLRPSPYVTLTSPKAPARNPDISVDTCDGSAEPNLNDL